MENLSTKSTIKFALLCGALTAIAAALCSLTFGLGARSRAGELIILLSGVVFAAPISLAPYLASKKGWVSLAGSMGRCLLAGLPLPFLPVAFFIGTIGWGDMQEHLVRALLHATHREASGPLAGGLLVAGIIVCGAVAVGSLIWISVSVLTNHWRPQTLLILWVGCATLTSLFWAALFAPHAGEAVVVVAGVLLVFLSGFLFALVVEMNGTPSSTFRVFRVASIAALLALIVGGSIFATKTMPEKRFPKLTEGPLWTFDIASTGCRTSWRGTTSSQASNEIAFASNDTLGMAFETAGTSLGNNNWEFKSCIFTVGVNSGTKIAQISTTDQQPIIKGTPDGDFSVRANGILTAFTPDLKQLGQPGEIEKPAEHNAAAHWRKFRSDPQGKLWFDGDGAPKLLGQYPPNEAYIQPLGPDRVLVTSGGQFSLFSSDGILISTEHFTREGVNFAALSADHRRFAVAIYLWGVGDPSYLEEEKIVVYDAETGKAIAAAPSVPLPANQSWAALSPDGTLLAVGAQSTLRLFRLPSAQPN